MPDEFRRLKQPVDELPPRRTKLRRPVEGEEPPDEIRTQDAVEDASAKGGAETGPEASKRSKEAGGDVFGVCVAQVQDVDERVVDHHARDETAETDRGDEYVGRGGRSRQLGQRVKGCVEAQNGDEQREVVRAGAADVKPADEEAAKGEGDVAGDEDGARGGGGAAADGEHEDGGVEDDAHAAGEEAELGEAGEEDAARGEDGEGDDWVGGEVELDGDEGEEGEEGEDEGGGVDVSCEGVEEEDNG